VISRVWVCSEQPLVLNVLALPLHPLVLLALVMCWGGLRLSGKPGAARAVGRVLAWLAALLGALSLGFALVGWLLGLAINPSPFLSLAPCAWALAGPLALWLGRRRARAVMASSARQSEPSPGVVMLATLSALVVFILIAARYGIADSARGLSLPYRFFEWAIVDELGPPTDECLAMRVLEYGRDEEVGRDALKVLARRGPSAAPGVRAQLTELRAHWPPPAYTIKTSGISQLLQKLTIYGDHATVEQWADFGWRHDFPHPKPEMELHLPR
jgi:hypothetical protein